jgi:CDP-diacylglycerol--serine O-phosphatidyltransferase
MVSKKPMLALKFSGVTAKKMLPFIIIALITIVSAIFIQWLAVPVSFLAYVILSLLNKQSSVL